MMPFAVVHEGLGTTPNGDQISLWVLAVDEPSNQFLLCGPEGFYWKHIDECTLARVHTPDDPTIVADMADLQAGNARLIVPGLQPKGGF